MNYKAFDIANHFVEYAGYDLNYSKIPEVKEIKSFLFVYNNSKFEYGQKDETVVSLSEVLYFMPITHLFWGLWALLRDGEGFDYFEYGCARIKRFIETYKV